MANSNLREPVYDKITGRQDWTVPQFYLAAFDESQYEPGDAGREPGAAAEYARQAISVAVDPNLPGVGWNTSEFAFPTPGSVPWGLIIQTKIYAHPTADTNYDDNTGGIWGSDALFAAFPYEGGHGKLFIHDWDALAEGDTITVGSKVYTLVASPAVDGEISLADPFTGLAEALNGLDGIHTPHPDIAAYKESWVSQYEIYDGTTGEDILVVYNRAATDGTVLQTYSAGMLWR